MGILTEEELNNLQTSLGPLIPKWVVDVFESHRQLFSANEELSFKNQKLKESLEDISTHIGNITSTQFYNDAYHEVKKLAYKALEETK